MKLINAILHLVNTIRFGERYELIGLNRTTVVVYDHWENRYLRLQPVPKGVYNPSGQKYITFEVRSSHARDNPELWGKDYLDCYDVCAFFRMTIGRPPEPHELIRDNSLRKVWETGVKTLEWADIAAGV